MFPYRLLRQKITELSHYDPGKIRRSYFVLERGIHFSASMYLRQFKVRNTDETKKSETLQLDMPFSEPSVYSNISFSESNENIDDIFGIESDDGAICFENSSLRLDKFQELVGKKPATSEIVRKTPFGQLRLDSENSRHLQKRRKYQATADKSLDVDFLPPSKEPSITKIQKQAVLEKLKKMKKHAFTFERKEIYENENETVQERDTMNLLSETNRGCVFSKSERKETSTEKLSDKILLKQLAYSDVHSFTTDNTNRIIGHESKQEDLINKTFFEGNTKSVYRGNICKEEISEIDDQYFSSIDNLSVVNLSKNSVNVSDISSKMRRNEKEFLKSPEKKDIPNTDKTDISLGIEKDKSFVSAIDEQYFPDILETDKAPSLEKSTEQNIEYQDRLTKSSSYTSQDYFNETQPNTEGKKALGSSTIEKENKVNNKRNPNVAKIQQERSTKSSSLGSIDHIERNIKLDSKGFRILTNQVVDLSRFTRAELVAELRTRILYSDDDVLVLNKPYNLVIHEATTNKEVDLSSLLDEFACLIDSKSTNPKLYTVHRLDKTTTGCLLLARNEMAAQHLKSLFAQRKITKTYWIVTSGVPRLTEGIIDMPIAEGKVGNKSRMVLTPELPDHLSYKTHSRRGKRAVTEYSIIATSGNAALIEAKSETGLKHQIRVHFGFGLNCPILGDHKYSHLDKLAPQKLPSDLLQRLYVRQSKVRHIPMHIHARSVTLPNYSESRNLFVTAPLPEHMRRNLQSLKFRKK